MIAACLRPWCPVRRFILAILIWLILVGHTAVLLAADSTLIIPSNLISRGKHVYANPDPGARAANVVNGHFFDSGWQPWSGADGTPAILAIDIGVGPSSLLWSWVSTGSTNYNETTYGGPGNYSIQVSGDSTDGANGTWTTVAAVTENAYRSREHRFAFSGKRWARMRITARSATCLQGYMNIDEVEVFDASASATDTWFFLGDSITAAAFRRQDALQPDFAARIHAAYPTFSPPPDQRRDRRHCVGGDDSAHQWIPCPESRLHVLADRFGDQ